MSKHISKSHLAIGAANREKKAKVKAANALRESVKSEKK